MLNECLHDLKSNRHKSFLKQAFNQGLVSRLDVLGEGNSRILKQWLEPFFTTGGIIAGHPKSYEVAGSPDIMAFATNPNRLLVVELKGVYGPMTFSNMQRSLGNYCDYLDSHVEDLKKFLRGEVKDLPESFRIGYSGVIPTTKCRGLRELIYYEGKEEIKL
jgi:hypothetical protein